MAEVSTADKGAEQVGSGCPDLGSDILGSGPVGHAEWVRDVGNVLIQRTPIWKNYAIHSPLLKYHDSGELGHGQRTDVPQKDARVKNVGYSYK